MAYGEPARRAARRTRHRSNALVVGLACLALLLTATAFRAFPRLLKDTARSYLPPGHRQPGGQVTPAPVTAQPSTGSGEQPVPVAWPRRGQAAYVVGGAQPEASPNEQPAPIASLAKVMTAYLTLKSFPLSDAQAGFTITVTAAQTEDEAQDAYQGQSVVAVRAGEQLNERQLLEALLIPSGNNIARIIAAQVAGSDARFVDEMNAEADAIGMDHSIYTDPSGFDPGTVSTAADELRLFQQAMRFPVFDQIVSMARVTLPVAGTVTNYDPLIAEGYAGKTGSDAAAGGCLAFFTHLTIAGRGLTAAGVVMGQGKGSRTSVLLAAAGKAAERLIESVAASDG